MKSSFSSNYAENEKRLEYLRRGYIIKKSSFSK